MNDIDITLYYNRYRLDAMERVLHSQGKSIEDAVYPMLDSLYEQLIPAVERGDIENRIAAENAQAAAEVEAAKRFALVHLEHGEDEFYLMTPVHKSLYDIASLYRKQLQPNIGKVPLWDLTGKFQKADRIFEADFYRMYRQMPVDKRITAAMHMEFGNGIIRVCDNDAGLWTVYRLKDISSAVYKAERKSGLSSDVRQGIFESTLRSQAVVRYLDEELEQADGDGVDEDEDPEEAEDPEPVLRL